MAAYNNVVEARQEQKKIKTRMTEITKCNLDDAEESVWSKPIKVVSQFKTKIELNSLQKKLDKSEKYLDDASKTFTEKHKCDETLSDEDDVYNHFS